MTSTPTTLTPCPTRTRRMATTMAPGVRGRSPRCPTTASVRWAWPTGAASQVPAGGVSPAPAPGFRPQRRARGALTVAVPRTGEGLVFFSEQLCPTPTPPPWTRGQWGLRPQAPPTPSPFPSLIPRAGWGVPLRLPALQVPAPLTALSLLHPSKRAAQPQPAGRCHGIPSPPRLLSIKGDGEGKEWGSPTQGSHNAGNPHIAGGGCSPRVVQQRAAALPVNEAAEVAQPCQRPKWGLRGGSPRSGVPGTEHTVVSAMMKGANSRGARLPTLQPPSYPKPKV